MILTLAVLVVIIRIMIMIMMITVISNNNVGTKNNARLQLFHIYIERERHIFIIHIL